MTVWEEMLSRLTDAYNRTTDSRLARLLRIAADEIQEVQDALLETRRQRDIDQAEGATLDLAGSNVQQFRGQAADPVYRLLIKSKVARNRSTGDVNSIIQVLSSTLSVMVEEIRIRELWDEGEPASLHMEVPTAALNEVGMSVQQFGRLTQKIVAAGVQARVFFEGTFSLSGIPDQVEIDPDQGLAPVDQSSGGRLGAIYDPDDDPELPL